MLLFNGNITLRQGPKYCARHVIATWWSFLLNSFEVRHQITKLWAGYEQDVRTDWRTDRRTRRRLYAPPRCFGEHKNLHICSLLGDGDGERVFVLELSSSSKLKENVIVLIMHVFFHFQNVFYYCLLNLKNRCNYEEMYLFCIKRLLQNGGEFQITSSKCFDL